MADSTSAPADHPTSEPGDPEDPGDGIKRKFREALERKRARQADANASRTGGNNGKVHSAHGPAPGRRAFRRKSG